MKLFHGITFTLRLQRINYFSCFDDYFGGSHQCLQNLLIMIGKDILNFFLIPQEFHIDCRDNFYRSINSFTLLWHFLRTLRYVSSQNTAISLNAIHFLGKIKLFMYLEDNPYITLANLWPFYAPSTHLISINTVLNVSKTGHFLDPPTHSVVFLM